MSVILMISTVISLGFNDVKLAETAYAADGEEQLYGILLNDEEMDPSETFSVTYGEALNLELKDIEGSATVNYYYSPNPEFEDENGTLIGGELVQTLTDAEKQAFAKANLSVGTKYYLYYLALVNGGQYISTKESGYSFEIVAAQISAPVASSEGYVLSWDAPTVTTKDSALDSGAVSEYAIVLKKGDAEISLADDLAKTTSTSVDLADYITENGYGTYYATVQAIAETETGNYVDSEVSESITFVYRDTVIPEFISGPSFDAETQTIAFSGNDTHTGICK